MSIRACFTSFLTLTSAIFLEPSGGGGLTTAVPSVAKHQQSLAFSVLTSGEVILTVFALTDIRAEEAASPDQGRAQF